MILLGLIIFLAFCAALLLIPLWFGFKWKEILTIYAFWFCSAVFLLMETLKNIISHQYGN